jgi:hypothetical protein
MVYPALLPLMRTPRLPVVDWTDAPADLNGLVRFAEKRNLVSAHSSNPVYQKYFLGGKGCRCVGLINLPPSCTECLEMWEPQPPGSLCACPDLYRDCFTFTFFTFTFAIMEQRYIWPKLRLGDVSYCWKFQVFWDVAPCRLVTSHFLFDGS